MIHVQRTSEREVKTPAPHKPHLSPSCTSIFSQQIHFVSQDFGTCILSLSGQVSALCFVHKHSWILLVQCHRLAYCDGRTRWRKVGGVAVPHSYAAHLKPLRGFAVTEDIHFSQDMSPSTRTKSMNRRDLLVRSGQATPIPQGRNVSRRTLSNSLPALPAIPSDHFSDTGNHESDDSASGTC